MSTPCLLLLLLASASLAQQLETMNPAQLSQLILDNPDFFIRVTNGWIDDGRPLSSLFMVITSRLPFPLDYETLGISSSSSSSILLAA